jgi:hypothetical protein
MTGNCKLHLASDTGSLAFKFPSAPRVPKHLRPPCQGTKQCFPTCFAPYPQAHQIAGPKFAVQPKVKKRKLPSTVSKLKSYPDGPDVHALGGSHVVNMLEKGGDIANAAAAGAAIGGGLVTGFMGILGFFLGAVLLIIGFLVGRDRQVVCAQASSSTKTEA